MGTYSNQQDEIPPMTSSDLKLLKRLKLSMFAVVVVLIVHGMAAKFPEIYPLVRWAMFSQAKEGPKELREGYMVTYAISVTYEDDTTRTFKNTEFYNGMGLPSSRANLASLAMVNAVDPDDPTTQEEFMISLFARAEELEGKQAQRIEVFRNGHLIDYDVFPSVNFDLVDLYELLGVLERDSTGTIREIEE